MSVSIQQYTVRFNLNFSPTVTKCTRVHTYNYIKIPHGQIHNQVTLLLIFFGNVLPFCIVATQTVYLKKYECKN